MPIKLITVRSGSHCVIRALAYPTPGIVPDLCPTLAFFTAQKSNPGELEKLASLLTFTAQNGPPKDQTKYRKLRGKNKIYEFKTSGGLRLLCFWDGPALIICTHGVTKLADKKFENEVTKAENSRLEYLAAKKKGDF